MTTLASVAAVMALSTAFIGPVHAGTLRIASQGDATSLDPHSNNESFTNYFLANANEGLVGRDRDFEIAGQLAESWEQIEAITWRFNLRPDVTFRDGSFFSADDVIFGMERALSETSNFKHFLALAESSTAVDSIVVEIKTKTPNPILLDLMILDKQWAKANGAQQPINLQADEKAYGAPHANRTGPLSVISRAQGKKTTLAAYDAYWGDQIIESPVEGNTFLDLRVRQAFAHAVDAQTIIDRVMQGQAALATRDLMDTVNRYDSDLERLEYNVETAKALLAIPTGSS